MILLGDPETCIRICIEKMRSDDDDCALSFCHLLCNRSALAGVPRWFFKASRQRRRARMVIYVEINGCMDLKRALRSLGIDVFIKCFNGSKSHRYRVSGIPDDDLDFAIRFLKTCAQFRASKCVAVVRDERIARIISKLLATEFPGLERYVEVVQTSRFMTGRDEVEALVIKAIESHVADNTAWGE